MLSLLLRMILHLAISSAKSAFAELSNAFITSISAVLVLTAMVSDLIISMNGINYIVFCILVIIAYILCIFK